MEPNEGQSTREVRALLRAYGLRPKKSLGQNFLVDSAALERVVAAAEVQPQDTILEVGAGLGTLTRELARQGADIVAVEMDQRLFPPLEEVLAPWKNVRLVAGDILALDPAELVGKSGYLVVANIPYYITSALIRHLLECAARPRRLVLTVQLEVAQRLCAAPGKLSLLALSVQVYGAPTIRGKIPAGAFYPVPGVDSAVVRVDLFEQPLIPPPRLERFFGLARAGFSQKRKTLQNALAGGLGWPKDRTGALLQKAGLDPRRRAQSLSLEEWGRLTAALEEGSGAGR
jgi:16S rRNA (adenine1518-N6/adenine1519-N6)-dimethyltransferase